MNKTANLMCDIETLSTEPNALILTIGACSFSFDDPNHEPLVFSAHIDQTSSEAAGLHISQATLDWWESQSDAAKAALNSSTKHPLDAVLEQFTKFCVAVRAQSPTKKLNWWGNDPTFDAVILESAYKAVGQTAPWAFWETKSCRTMDLIGEEYGFRKKRDLPRTGVHHSAVDDSLYQAEVVKKVMSLIKASASNAVNTAA
ncbi:MAG: 3'-5' exonuclease [Cellvibrionaceae bacterium]